jgi:PQQ-dependent dehydrogenase (methanol/ethanol family)
MLWLVLAAAVAAPAGTPLAADALSFSAAQAAEGRQVYATSCAACHGDRLEGAAAQALAGTPFTRSWVNSGRTLREFYEINSRQMPLNAPGTLSERQSLAVSAFILERNGYAAGASPLEIVSLDRTLAAGGPSPESAPARAAAPRGELPARPAHVEQAQGHAPGDSDLLQISAADWLTYNRTLYGDRYSPLAEINVENVHQLKVQCLLQLGELGSFETSPLVFDGRMYLTTPHKLIAVDGATCRPFWSYTYVPVDPEHLPGNRGVALYQGKVFRGTTDGHLIALDAATGKLLWDVRVADGAFGYEITGAPIAFDGKVFTGDSGADVGIKGKVYAFDAGSGTLVWSFDMIPTGNQPGAETWGGGTEHGGGATWSSMAIDPVRRLLFVPTGNPASDFNDRLRPGINLYTDSVIALSLDSGKLAWYVQQVPHDVHDWDTAAAPALFDQGGRRYMAVASKNGLLYLYDRDDHRLLSSTPFTTRENVAVPLRSDQPVHVCPGALGQYNGPAYSPRLELVFLGAADRCNTIQVGEARYVPGGVYFGGVFKLDPKEKQSGWIRAFDPTNGREVWRVHRDDPILAAVTPTAGGLLFTGDSGGQFLALDARSGQLLYRFTVGGPVAAAITTYAVTGKQFIAVPAGSSSRDAASANGAATLVVFSLP